MPRSLADRASLQADVRLPPPQNGCRLRGSTSAVAMKDGPGSIRTDIQRRSGGAVFAAGERGDRFGCARDCDRHRHLGALVRWCKDARSRPARGRAWIAFAWAASFELRRVIASCRLFFLSEKCHFSDMKAASLSPQASITRDVRPRRTVYSSIDAAISCSDWSLATNCAVCREGCTTSLGKTRCSEPCGRRSMPWSRHSSASKL